MDVSIVTAARGPSSDIYGWCSVVGWDGNWKRISGTFPATGFDGTDAVIMATINSVHKALTGGMIADGDRVVLGVEDISAVSELILASRNPEHGSPVIRKASESMTEWRRRFDLRFETRHWEAKDRFGRMGWARGLCIDMAMNAMECVNMPEAEPYRDAPEAGGALVG